MAGNKTTFDQSMRHGDDAAWNQEWPKAIDAYMAAIREFPTSTLACNSLGYALFQAGRLEDAFKVYSRAHDLDPDDPLPVEKNADVLERMGRLNEAAEQYLMVAEIYFGQHDFEKAIANWERATEINPGLIKILQKLAIAYERTGQRDKAIDVYLKLAFHLQKMEKNDIALKALQRGVRLDAKHPRLLNAMTAVRNNQPISPDLLESKTSGRKHRTDEFGQLDPALLQDAESDARGPIGEAVEHSLEMLAQAVFEGGMMEPGSTEAIQAIELHRAGIADEAAEAYQRAANSGMRTPAMLFNLGVLLVEEEQWRDALQLLEQIKARADPIINAGAVHAISLCHIGMKDWLSAAQNLIQTLRLVDLDLAIDEDEAGELDSVYSRLASMIGQSDQQSLEGLSTRLADMLTGSDWKQRVALTRSQIDDMIQKDVSNLVEIISAGDTVVEAMTLIDRYIQQKRYIIAMDEAHHIIERAPDYLGVHLRVAQIMMDLSQVEQAIRKYNMIARTYLMRGEDQKAAEILNEVIKVAPADINLRTNLIELLEQQERWDEMLNQYIDLAVAYQSMADSSNARTTLEQAVQLARRNNAPTQRVVEIMHKLGAVDMERVELRGAMRTYQQICEMVPDDVDARRNIVDIHYRLGNAVQGIQDLDQLLQIYARQQRPDLILEVLENLGGTNPDDMALHHRLGGVYAQMGQPENALEEFEQLRKLQADAGLHEEANQTIKRIISLNPPNVEHYQQLLQQMGGT